MKLFLIGMSGIGMQGLAVVLKKNGNEVYGFDDANELENLKEIGIVYQNIIPSDTNYVILSSGIRSTHPLIEQAKKLNIPCINRTDFWIDHMQLNENKILIAGSHGKTTTTSIIAYILGMKSYMIGGIINGYKFPANHIQDEYTTIETDESDGSFNKWHGKYKILLNFDYEHMDFFKTNEKAELDYKQFANESQTLIINIETQEQLEIIETNSQQKIITFGKKNSHEGKSISNISEKGIFNKKDPEFYYHDIEFADNGLYFKINDKPIFLPLFGEHNACNFTGAYALLANIGMKHDEIAEKIVDFPGLKKRMQKIMEKNGYIIYSDYGHHPTEIKACLDAYLAHKKIKPDLFIELHRYTRLAYTWQQWPNVLKNHKIFITKMHTANEDPIENINEHTFIKYLNENNIDASYCENFEDYIPNNVTICFSAGKLSSILDKLAK